jgi:RNA polymerase sigma-70 factor, ECF subfamily
MGCMDRHREQDRRLAERAGEGDEHAFALLVERHRAGLLRYVARRFGADPAEDAVQEALLSAHRALLAGTRPADVRAWLATIAWRRALDMTRREREAVPLDTDVAAAGAEEPEAKLLAANELGRVVAAFTELPERQQAALRLSALEGRSLEEIGRRLDVAPEAAKSLVARSRRTLTHRLAAADLCCADVRLRMEEAAQRGVRLAGELSLHLETCRPCARAHREIRRRRRLRVALVIPFGFAVRTAHLRDRLRDLIALNPAWEAQAGAAKLCTAACLTAVGAGTAASPAVIVSLPARPTATPVVAEGGHAKARTHHRKRAKPKPTPTATATPVWTPAAAPTTVATAVPTLVATPTDTPTSPPALVAESATGESLEPVAEAVTGTDDAGDAAGSAAP